MELAQVRLLVGDFAACYRFYADVLGLKPQSGSGSDDGPPVRRQLDGTRL